MSDIPTRYRHSQYAGFANRAPAPAHAAYVNINIVINILVKALGFDTEELRAAGFTAKELRDAGFNLEELSFANFSLQQFRAGFTTEELRAAGFWRSSEDEDSLRRS